MEYELKEEAATAIKKMNGKELLGQTVGVNWSFVAK